MNNDNDIANIYEKEKQNILKNIKLNKKDDLVLIEIYLDLLEQFKKNNKDKKLYENIKMLEKYIFI